ncbi:unnamed protein product [Linum trigynum]
MNGPSTFEAEHEELKEIVRRMVTAATSAVEHKDQKLRLIDDLQHLGVSYHFEGEIEAELLNMTSTDMLSDSNDLNSIAIWFRLLRQQGLNASPDIFEKFKDGEGNFLVSLASDVPSLLSLYEACFLAIPGEDILDQALAFTTQHLDSYASNHSGGNNIMNPKLAEEVRFALPRPIRKRLPRLEARRFIDTFNMDDQSSSHDISGSLLRFAQLDFNIVQRLHQEELREIQQWWVDLDVATNFKYARDRIVECYLWIMGMYFEPKYSQGRRLLTKLIAVMSLGDDTYDNYATYEELAPFTEAIEKWDIDLVTNLPECMQKLYALYRYRFDEIEDAFAAGGRPFGAVYAKKALDTLLKAYLMEAKWRDEDYRPNLEEYMQVSLVTTCFTVLTTVSFLAVPEAATEDTFHWISTDPTVLVASKTVCRLMDDIVSHKFEQERKHVPSAVECYVDKTGLSEEKVVGVLNEQIAKAWKDMNKEYLMMNRPPNGMATNKPILDPMLNLARVIDVIYKEDDGFRNSHLLKHYVVSVLQEPVSLVGHV